MTETSALYGAARQQKKFEEMKQELGSHLAKARGLTDAASAANRELTGDEHAEVERHLAACKDLGPRVERQRQIAAVQEQAELLTSCLRGVGSPEPIPGQQGSSSYGGGLPGMKVAGRRWANAVIRANSDSAGNYKGLTPAGTVVVDVPSPDVVALGKPVASVRQLIPTLPSSGMLAFFRQTLRDNRAAPVAQGALKPTSIYNLERVEERVRTLAHLSEPMHRTDFSDAPLLAEFVGGGEMLYGLERALEDQILNGSGVGENMTGLANTSGVQTVALVTGPATGPVNLLISLRRGLTRLEQQGLTASGFVLSPADWESVETAYTTTGGLVLAEGGQTAVPVDSAARRLWGVPVVSTPACPVGTAYACDFLGSTRLYVREEMRLDWSENVYDPDALGAGVGATDFERNMLRMRAEMRAYFAVTRPSGCVKISLV
jgi:HK97 family phage major capsid protein